MEARPMVAELIHTDRCRHGRTDITKLTGASHYYLPLKTEQFFGTILAFLHGIKYRSVSVKIIATVAKYWLFWLAASQAAYCQVQVTLIP
jgi:hypothetical protein